MYVHIYKIFLTLDEKMLGALELSSASAAASRFAILLGLILTSVWFVLANKTMTDSFENMYKLLQIYSFSALMSGVCVATPLQIVKSNGRVYQKNMTLFKTDPLKNI